MVDLKRQSEGHENVRLAPMNSKVLWSASVCLRFYTELQDQTFIVFSMDVPTQSNSIALFRRDIPNEYHLYINGEYGTFYGLPFDVNKWNSICLVWDASNRLSQITVNQIRSVKKTRHVSPGDSVAGTPIITLGQDQDSYGGSFDASQAFIGHIRAVHMWDYVISACEIQNYMQGLAYSPGNYLDWGRMDYSIHGYVLLEDYETC